MKSRVRLLWSDGLATVGVLAFVLAVLVSIDPRVREQLQLVASPSAVGGFGTQANEVISSLFLAAQTQSLEHAPLMIFIVVATVLLLCMMRT